MMDEILRIPELDSTCTSGQAGMYVSILNTSIVAFNEMQSPIGFELS